MIMITLILGVNIDYKSNMIKSVYDMNWSANIILFRSTLLCEIWYKIRNCVDYLHYTFILYDHDNIRLTDVGHSVVTIRGKTWSKIFDIKNKITIIDEFAQYKIPMDILNFTHAAVF